MPFTRLSPSIEPNGPNESRSETMRLARVGPTCRSASISFSPATSRSTGPAGLGGVLCFLSRFGFLRRDRRAESAAFIWASSAERALESDGAWLWRTRYARVEAPRTSTTAKKRRAFRSAGVGMMRPYRSQSGLRHRSRAARSVLFHRRGEKERGQDQNTSDHERETKTEMVHRDPRGKRKDDARNPAKGVLNPHV